MTHYESPRSHSEGQWSPPLTYAEPQGYREPQEMSVTDHTDPNSPRTSEGYWNSPPMPPKGWTYDAPPPDHDAPEVVQQPYYDHNSRPLSPSSQGGTTLYSPRPPPADLHHDKDNHESYIASGPPLREERTICGIRKRLFIIFAVIAFLLILGLALGLGLGLGLTKKKESSDPKDEIDPFCRDHPELCIGGALGSQYYSTKGAFNGSGIALAGEAWNQGQRRIFTLYFQHHSGDIRFMQYTTKQEWIGGSKSETVATDAKNATAISTVAYAMNATQYFHVFYITKDNFIKQVTKSNVSDIWEAGPLTKLNLKVYDSPATVGMQACWKGNFYGSSDFSKMPTATGEKNTIPFEDRRAMNIWFPVDDSTFQQYSWYNEAPDKWVEMDKWQGKNVHSGVGCYSWGEGTTTYTMMSNKNNDTEFWWKDTNENITSTEKHPTQSWQNATNGIIEDTYPSTSLGYTTYFYAQMADRSVKGFNITYQAENTTIVPEDTFALSDPAGVVKGLGGTHLTATAYTEMDGETKLWDSLYVFYQTEGSDITAFTRGIQGGQWTSAPLVIPDD